ncbi:PspA/IM30 family protein [Kocuria sp. JC486]|uniref:PspA/IM30 family protein n=1 Tax=Kocuria soli TaxID=2485125 RepID=A0A3N4A2M5_9MICC|nr:MULTISPECIES: PspA/IM30 family protein [Kocuria]NHU84461.1 PspA/IM30 family protein [Kocuria sp. JC486]ROZ62629.1 PspA/IM30 family protein [Kocuria soli]
MSAKQSIFGRVAQLAKANINALIDSAEDPQKMLDQMVRDYTQNIREAESAVATTIGQLRMLEQDHAEDVRDAEEWGNKALAASTRADQFRSAGQSTEADKFDNLAKVALQRQMQHESEASASAPQIEAQTRVVDQLKDGLNKMHGKLQELSAKRDELNARQKTVAAQAAVQDSLKAFDVMDPLSEVSRFEDKVRREEARIAGQQELAASSLDAQFESLEELGRQSELEARLAALKAGGSGNAAKDGEKIVSSEEV